MNILVVGGSRGTGAQAVRVALERGHRVTAFSRDPGQLELDSPGLKKVAGDFLDPAAVDAVVPGHEAVIVTAALSTLKGYRETPDFFTRGTRHVIGAMHRHGVRRLVVQSAFGVGESAALLNPLIRVVVRMILGVPFADHAAQEKLVRESGLAWVIARPSGLSSRPGKGRSSRRPPGEPVFRSISRRDLAEFLVEAATGDAWQNRIVHLGG